MVIVYFNVQGVVDPRDGHCLLYIDLCESMGDPIEGDLWEHSIPKQPNIFLFLQPDIQSQFQYCILQNIDVPVITY